MAVVLEAAGGHGKYVLHGIIASGGMATIHLGRQLGPHGFARLVAIKRLHPHLCKDPHFAAMLLDEARLAARIKHPNVIPPLDIVVKDGELFLVLEYVEGEALSKLIGEAWTNHEQIPRRIAGSIVADALYGLHAAHEVKRRGASLDIVHRDVSPQNVLVGVDGLSRVFDFGLAKAAVRAQETKQGHVKGKLVYMAPEQLRGEVSRRTDIYAAGIVLWELLAGRYAFAADAPVTDVIAARIVRPGRFARDLPSEVDDVVMRALQREPEARYATALDMAAAIEQTLGRASGTEVSEWVMRVAATQLALRARLVADVEREAGVTSTKIRAAAPAAPPASIEPAADAHPAVRATATAPTAASPTAPSPSGPSPSATPRSATPPRPAPNAGPPATHGPAYAGPRAPSARPSRVGRTLFVALLLVIVAGGATVGFWFGLRYFQGRHDLLDPRTGPR